MRRLGVAVVGIAILLITSACRVDTTVQVVVGPDGAGEVVVVVDADAEAAEHLAGSSDELKLDDLTKAGWTVERLELGAGLRLVVSKPFPTADALPAVVGEIFGPGVVIRDVSLDRQHDFSLVGLDAATTAFDLRLEVDPSPDLSVLGDSDLARQLGGLPIGRDLSQAEVEAGGSFADALGLSVTVALPSTVQADSGTVDGSLVTWTFSYGDEVSVLEASASTATWLPRLWAVVALGAGLMGFIVAVARTTGWLVAKARAPKGRRRRDQRQREARAATRQAEASRPRRRLLRLLILDVHGVIVTPSDPLEELLVPMVSGLRPDTDPDQVRELHRRLTLGRISPEEFWDNLDLGEQADEVESRYLSSFRLVPGLHTFLGRMANSRLPVSAVGNQPREWGNRLRRMASLDGVLSSWLVSGEVGARLPDPALFEATRRTMSVDLYDCFYLSNRPEHLDAAHALDVATGLFVANGQPASDTNHLIVRGFDDLLRNRGT